MRYVIIRDDDTNALTPIECLERLYRPLLDRGLPVNLAVIPDVATDASTPDGRRESFLFALQGGAGVLPGTVGETDERCSPSLARSRKPDRQDGCPAVTATAPPPSQSPATVPIGTNTCLVDYLRSTPGYHVVQHGCHHDCFEFDRSSVEEISGRLEQGTHLLMEAGFPQPQTFVAPHDRLSRTAFREVARRFRILSTGWFELRRLPVSWWPRYAAKKIRRAPHWRAGRTWLLSHPGCLLSCHRPRDSTPENILRNVRSRELTVLVTHWWEYFREGRPDDRFIQRLHDVGEALASDPEIRVISFADLAANGIRG